MAAHQDLVGGKSLDFPERVKLSAVHLRIDL